MAEARSSVDVCGLFLMIIMSWVVWVVAVLLPMLICNCFFYADGAYFFLYILEHQSINFAAIGRSATYILTQWPVVLAIKAGCTNIQLLSWLFGMGYMLPLALLHGLSILLLLRREMYVQSVVYVVMLWLIMGYSGIFVITDLHTPTALFLFAVVLSITFNPERVGSWLVLAVIALISLELYEFWAFYSFILLGLLVWRAWPHWSAMSLRVKRVCIVTVLIFVTSVAINAWRLLHSSGNPNQASLLSMLWRTTYPVYLFLIASWFIGVCGHFWLEARSRAHQISRFLLSGRSRAWILLVSFVLLVLLCVIQHNTMVRYSYPFRTLSLILPMVYCVWLVFIARENGSSTVPTGGRGLLLLVIIWLVVNQAWMTIDWKKYHAWAGSVRRVDKTSIYVAQSPSTSIAKAWIFPWTHPAHSFVSQALRFRKVQAIAYDPSAKYKPYGPGNKDRVLSIALKYGIQVE